MSEDETVSLFAATAAGGTVIPERYLWDMVTDEVDGSLFRPTPEGTTSAWGLDPANAASFVADGNDTDNDGVVNDDVDNSVDTDHGEIIKMKSVATSMAGAVGAEHQQQEKKEKHKEKTDRDVILLPAGDEMMFGWCKEVRPLVFCHDLLRDVG